MRYEELKDSIKKIAMPEQMKENLINGCRSRRHTDNFRFRHSRAAAALLTAAAILLTVSMPAYAAYDLYQTKNLAVFFDYGTDREQIDELGEALSAMDGIVSVRFVSADDAWKDFAENYLTEELAASFDTNPLADSANYEVTVGLSADTQAVREQILQLTGVRRLADRYEQKEGKTAAGK